MRILYLLAFVLLPLTAKSQLYNGLSAEERAYLFHVVKKSPILNNNIGRYFDYQGPEITLKNGGLNYDSIELLIINKPELLMIRTEEISKSAKGLIAEAANKMAVWELNKVLLAKRSSSKDLKQYSNEYKVFEDSIMLKLPENALRLKDGALKPHPKLSNVLNPSLNLKDKMAVLESMRFLTVSDQYQTLTAMNFAVNAYVQKRAREIYHALGGKANQYHNVLVAAGDGSRTAGILEEREKDERGRWNKGLPKAVGLFPYQLVKRTETIGKRTATKIAPLMFTENNFLTVGNNRYTNIHMDVWGYNADKQTTVVLEKNGLSYHLFGSGETRFLSPDSSFSSGKTFQATINDLEFNKIGGIYENIYGKKGYDYWIEYNTKKKDATELKIEKLEKEYSDMGYSPIMTSSKPSRKVKRSKRKAIKNNSGSFDGTPTTSSGKKSKKKLQKEIVYQYGRFEAYRKTIAELEEEKQAAIDLMAQYQRVLDTYKTAMGRHWAEFEEKDGLYTFQDSSTFDITTQEFKFPPSKEFEPFEIRLVAIPTTALSELADEVMLHINILDAEPNYDARVQVEFNDIFKSDKWDLPGKLFSQKDSVAMQVFFEGLLDKKTDFEIIVRGQGIGVWDGTRTVKNPSPKELKAYPNTKGREKSDSIYSQLRRSELFVHMDRGIALEINSYTDPVKSNLDLTSKDVFTNVMAKFSLSKNDILSAYRSYAILNQFKTEMNVLAGKYLSREQARIVIDRFNKKMAKSKITVGRTSFKLSAFAD
jgi:hypothetical protein